MWPFKLSRSDYFTAKIILISEAISAEGSRFFEGGLIKRPKTGVICNLSSGKPILIMQSKQRIFALVARLYPDSIVLSLGEIAKFLTAAGHVVVFETETAQSIARPDVPTMSLEEIGSKADAAIVLGGDGTMLGISRDLAPYSVPIIGINHGRLGFMADIPLNRVLPVLDNMLKGKFVTEQRFLLEGSIVREGDIIYQANAFNDIVVCRGAGSGMVDLRVTVDGHFMYQQRSDGLIISTPTGSTAYALSAGGPMLHPNLGGILLVAIAPHTLSNRPIVVPDTSEIVIEVVASNNRPGVNFDSQSFASLDYYDRIIIKRSPNTITFLHPQGWSFYDTLRNKLHWNEISHYDKGE
jgi:NAD+ kinase